MRLVPALLVCLSSGAAVPARSVVEDAPRLSYELGEISPPSHTDPRFLLGYLTEGGCSPLYVTSPREGCALFRAEPAWVDLTVRWTGAAPLRLQPTRTSLVALLPRRVPARVGSWPLTARWRPGPGQRRATDGSFEVTATTRLTFRVDLTPLAQTAPAGGYDLCFVPNLAPPRGVRWNPPTLGACYQFELFEADSTAARLETLRRQAVELLADYNCRDLLPVVESMLALDPGNAAAYRLRGTVAELESRVMDAIADYAQASHLLRTGGDRFLPQTPEVRAGYADSLDDWRIGLELAGGLSLLHADGDGPTCR